MATHVCSGKPRRELRDLTHHMPIARRAASRRRESLILAAFGILVAAVVVAPLTRRGWLLLLDWVPGPRGIGPTGRAAVPSGPAFVLPARALHATFGAAVGWLPIAFALGFAAIGAARLVGDVGDDGWVWPAGIVAGVAYAVNPFVYDRLYAGQVSVLAGYAVLPWLARAAVHAHDLAGAVRTGLWLALAGSCTLHFVWIGALLVLCIALVRMAGADGPRAMAGVAVVVSVGAVVVLAWFVPTMLGSDGDRRPHDTERVLTTFETRSDPDLGRSLGLLAQQGFWRPAADRPRDDLGAAFVVIAGASIAAAVTGLILARRSRAAVLAGGIALAGIAGWLLAHGAAGPAGALYRFAWRSVPGFDVMREAQKWNALVSLMIATGLGLLARELARRGSRTVAWALLAVPVALAPTTVWGLWNRIEPSRYPASWAAARLEVDAVDGDVIALPWEHYILPGFTGNRTVAQPAPAYFGRRVVASDDSGVAGIAGDTGRRATRRVGVARRTR